ncbi:MAG TPA: low molecular weight protein-tyrosine-phosphatase [Bacteroidia bacterium]|nr:low molecular weight protein-tyrosine-phosphatase [Bacteroidia bacterium]HRG54380.1 low molecular weight protein-tyrosine-phosphatase [Bacteroidia bacterium]
MTKILMVCLGNICRSPIAEGILRDKAEKADLDILIDSAGTSNYHIGDHPDKRTILNAKRHQIDISHLCARQFTVADFDKFDYIFAMDSSNYADIISLARNDQDRYKVELILNRVYPNSNMSVPDPYFGGEQGFENVYILLDKACDVIIESLKKM